MVEEIRPNLHRIEIPLPNNPLKSTNSYVLTSEERNLVIDTGFNRKECLEALQDGFDSLDLDLAKTDFFSTHLHADHLGLISTFAGSDSKSYMGAIDVQRIAGGGGWERMLKYGNFAGFPTEVLRSAMVNHPGNKHGPERELEWTEVVEGDTITIGDFELKCLETPGHTPGHICLYESRQKILFTGDHILGDITPNIQVWAREDDPLYSYIGSLNKIAELDVVLTLPGHRTRIRDCGVRIQELKKHHLNRCNEVLDILKTESQHAYRTASRMNWQIKAKSWEDFPLMQKWFATGEALAHLRFLENKKRVAENVSSDEIVRYSLVNGTASLESID